MAKSLGAKQPLLLHFASSDDLTNLMPEGGTRIQPPAGLCQGTGITWAARIGSVTYGEWALMWSTCSMATTSKAVKHDTTSYRMRMQQALVACTWCFNACNSIGCQAITRHV